MTMSNNGSLIIDKDKLQGKVLLLFGYLKRSSIRKERVKGQIIPINVFNQNNFLSTIPIPLSHPSSPFLFTLSQIPRLLQALTFC